MEEQLVQYFLKEKSASMLLLWIGVFGLLSASLLLKFSLKKWLIGLSYPTSVISVILTVLGCSIYWRTPTQVEKLTLMYLGTPHSFFETELYRMEKIIMNFSYYNYVEMAFIALGLILCVVAVKTRGFIFGTGLSLFFYGSVLLSFDEIAIKRAELYYQSLIKYSNFEQ